MLKWKSELLKCFHAQISSYFIGDRAEDFIIFHRNAVILSTLGHTFDFKCSFWLRSYFVLSYVVDTRQEWIKRPLSNSSSDPCHLLWNAWGVCQTYYLVAASCTMNTRPSKIWNEHKWVKLREDSFKSCFLTWEFCRNSSGGLLHRSLATFEIFYICKKSFQDAIFAWMADPI